MNKSKCFEVCWPLKPKRSFLTSWILFMSFAKILSGTQLECQTFWMQTRNDFQLVLILVLTVCKVISRRHCLSDEMLYTVTRVFLHISVQWHRSQFYNIKCKLYIKYNRIEPERSFFYKLFVVCWLFFKILFSINSFRNTLLECQSVWIKIRINILLGPDLGPYCLQRLSADDKSLC